jgi:hypothetical protein
LFISVLSILLIKKSLRRNFVMKLFFDDNVIGHCVLRTFRYMKLDNWTLAVMLSTWIFFYLRTMKMLGLVNQDATAAARDNDDDDDDADDDSGFNC